MGQQQNITTTEADFENIQYKYLIIKEASKLRLYELLDESLDDTSDVLEYKINTLISDINDFFGLSGPTKSKVTCEIISSDIDDYVIRMRAPKSKDEYYEIEVAIKSVNNNG